MCKYIPKLTAVLICTLFLIFGVSTQTNGQFKRANANLEGVINGASAIADLNNDGSQDLLIAGGPDNNPTATVYIGDGSGNFEKRQWIGIKGVEHSALSVADVNKDGILDVLLTGNHTILYPETATLYLGTDSTYYHEANVGLKGVQKGSTSIADVNQDSIPDLLITGLDTASNRSSTLYIGDSTGGYTPANADLVGVSNSSSAIADFNNDGNMDLFIAGEDSADSYRAQLYFGNGNGDFSKSLQTTLEESSIKGDFSGVADVNEDGNLDLLISTWYTSADLFLGKGDGEFTNTGEYSGGGLGGACSITDINEDGNLDLLVAGGVLDDVGTCCWPGAIIMLGDGKGNFSEADLNNVPVKGVKYSSSSVGDVNNDGLIDWLVTGEEEGDNPVAVLHINTGTEFTNIELNNNLPQHFKLKANHPNPFNPTTQIEFSLPQVTDVKLTVYDMLGRRVATLVDGKRQAGQHSVTFNASNLSSGVYIYRLKTDGFSESRKMLLVK